MVLSEVTAYHQPMGAWTLEKRRLVMADYDALVTYKNMKNISVRIKPPHGEVAVSAPLFTPEHVIVDFLNRMHGWILTRRKEVRRRSAPTQSLATGARVPLWGSWRHVVVEDAPRESARVVHTDVHIQRPTGDDDAAWRAMDALYRRETGPLVTAMLEAWEPRVGRSSTQVRLKRMTSRWGSCQPTTGAMTFNTMLAKYRAEALEYVVVHELVHLWEPGHGPGFTSRMSAHLPDWPRRRQMLREAPC